MLSGDAFAAVLKSRQRRRSSHFSLHWLSGNSPDSRLGLVVPKRLARTSVRRNLIKRQVRSLFQAWSRTQDARGGPNMKDVVVKLTAPVAGLDRGAQYAELGQLMQSLPRD